MMGLVSDITTFGLSRQKNSDFTSLKDFLFCFRRGGILAYNDVQVTSTTMNPTASSTSHQPAGAVRVK
jgi:hypothetical protein